MDRPILMNDEMVRRLLAGEKSQTRRPMNPQPPADAPAHIALGDTDNDRWGFWNEDRTWVAPWSPGDHLWVRECWWTYPKPVTRHLLLDGADTWPTKNGTPIAYNADGDCDLWRDLGWVRKPSIHMPRWASRIRLEVLRVWAERVQEISEEDADAEGFGGDIPCRAFPDTFHGDYGHLSIPECYGVLWDSIYAKRGLGWDSNCWVWACEFRRKP